MKSTGKGGAFRAFLKRKNVEFSAKRYGIDALGAMAQGLFASLLIGTIIGTLGEQLGLQVLVQIGDYAKAASGPAMAAAIGYALKCPPLVLFSLIAVGGAANALGGAGGPLAVLVVAIVASECGKIVSKETKIDIIVTPSVTIIVGVLLSMWCAPAIGAAANTVGDAIMWATDLQPFFMGHYRFCGGGRCPDASHQQRRHLRGPWAYRPCRRSGCGRMLRPDGRIRGNEFSGKPLGRPFLPRASAPLCCRWETLYAIPESGSRPPWLPPSPVRWPPVVFKMQMNGAAISSGMGTCGFVGQIGVYTGWVSDVESGVKAAITAFDWLGLVLICFLLPAVLTVLFAAPLRKHGWIKENDLKLDL